MSFLLLLLGIALLYFGGELLVRNASHLARALRLSPLVIGLTVVAFGTSAPELAATLAASFRDAAPIALGNIVGSNIANIGLILGFTALLYVLKTEARFIRQELPFMIISGALLFPLLWDGRVGRLEGIGLFALLLGYIGWLLRRDEAPTVDAEFEQAYGRKAVPLWLAALGALGGVVLLVAGAQALIEGAVTLARLLGVPEQVIGLTMVAVGTSLPELASSIVAALKREGDIVLGNIVGSNIFNVLAILGVTGMVRPLEMPLAAVTLDLWVMLGFSLLVPIFFTGLRFGRWEGATMLVLYLVYVVFLYS